jgi:DNA-binding XRE family transcriptional regulator
VALQRVVVTGSAFAVDPAAQAEFDRALYKQWGDNVRAARGTAWTQQSLADACGVHRAAIANIENGRRCPEDWLKWRIAGALRKTLHELFPWPADVPPFPTTAVA